MAPGSTRHAINAGAQSDRLTTSARPQPPGITIEPLNTWNLDTPGTRTGGQLSRWPRNFRTRVVKARYAFTRLIRQTQNAGWSDLRIPTKADSYSD